MRGILRRVLLLVAIASLPRAVRSAETPFTLDTLPSNTLAGINRLDLLTVFAADDQDLLMRAAGYVFVDHRLPLKTRVQTLADMSFGRGRLAVESIETSGTIRIAHIAMLEDAAVTKDNQAWWYLHFQGSTGNELMHDKIQKTFAQDDYPGDWIDRAILTSKFWLGSHAENDGPAYGAGARRTGWRWRAENLDRPPGSDQTVIIPIRLSFSSGYSWPIFDKYDKIKVKLSADERLVCTMEVVDPVSRHTLSIYTRSLFSSFVEKVDTDPPSEINDPEFYRLLKQGKQPLMRIYATNCALRDLYPPEEKGRTLLQPEGFVFREVLVQPLETDWHPPETENRQAGKIDQKIRSD